MLLVNLFISCHRTSNNPQLSNITVLHTIKLLKQLNTSYVLGCTCRKKKIVELELGEREKGGSLSSSLHELQRKWGLPPTENRKLTIQQLTGPILLIVVTTPVTWLASDVHQWPGYHGKFKRKGNGVKMS